jgi:ArsR family transcriptional regulator
VGDLSKGLSIAPSTVSHPIKELHRAGLIRTRRRGRQVACWIDPEILHRLRGFFIAPGPE